MSVKNSRNKPYREDSLYFNKGRILRWMRWLRRNKDIHPDLQAYEKRQHEEKRRSKLWRWIRKTS